MKTVAVSQRVDSYPDRGENRDALDQRLIDFLVTCGYLPLPTPNSLAGSAGDAGLLHVWLDAAKVAAIVLSGGNDIGTFKDRDRTEANLLEYARTRNLPVLGICRGMQFLAHQAGAELIEAAGHVRTRHQLRGEIGGNVNSYHNFILAECPQGYNVTASAEDCSIEAIRHRVLPWEGWMWHPERESEYSTEDMERLKSLFG